MVKLCTCGHRKGNHTVVFGCGHWIGFEAGKFPCPCCKFQPRETPWKDLLQEARRGQKAKA